MSEQEISRVDDGGDNIYLKKVVEREKEKERLEKLDGDWKTKISELKSGEAKDTWTMLEKQGFLAEEKVKETLRKTGDIAATAAEILKTASIALEIQEKDAEIARLKGVVEAPPEKKIEVDNPDLKATQTASGSEEQVGDIIDFTGVDIEKLPDDVKAFAKRTAQVQKNRKGRGDGDNFFS